MLGAACWLVITLPRLPDDPDSLLAESGINIYAASGELLYTVNQRVGRVGLDEVHSHFVQAVLAVEDSDFYHHRGYSIKGMVGAFFENIRHWGRVRGGSTITQQIVKKYLSYARESFICERLKKFFSQHNSKPFLNATMVRAIKTDCSRFISMVVFTVPMLMVLPMRRRPILASALADLTLLEAAILAGLPNAPSVLNPFRKDQSRVLARARLVLNPHAGIGFY